MRELLIPFLWEGFAISTTLLSSTTFYSSIYSSVLIVGVSKEFGGGHTASKVVNLMTTMRNEQTYDLFKSESAARFLLMSVNYFVVVSTSSNKREALSLRRSSWTVP
jgi:hypothetical protein